MVHLGLRITPWGTKSGFCRQGGWGTHMGRQMMSCLPQGVSGRELWKVPSKTPYCGEGEAGGWRVREDLRKDVKSVPPEPQSICGSLPALSRSRWHLQIWSRFLKKVVPAQEAEDVSLNPGLHRKLRKGTCAWDSAAKNLPPAISLPLETRPPTRKSWTTENLNSFSSLGLWDLTRGPHGCCKNLSYLSILDIGTVPLYEEKPLGIVKDFLFFSKTKEGHNLRSQNKYASFKSITSSPLGSLNQSLICILRESKAYCPQDTGAGREEREHSGQEGGLQIRQSPHLEMLWRLVSLLILS